MKPFLVGFSVARSLPLWELLWNGCGRKQGSTLPNSRHRLVIADFGIA